MDIFKSGDFVLFARIALAIVTTKKVATTNTKITKYMYWKGDSLNHRDRDKWTIKKHSCKWLNLEFLLNSDNIGQLPRYEFTKNNMMVLSGQSFPANAGESYLKRLDPKLQRITSQDQKTSDDPVFFILHHHCKEGSSNNILWHTSLCLVAFASLTNDGVGVGAHFGANSIERLQRHMAEVENEENKILNNLFDMNDWRAIWRTLETGNVYSISDMYNPITKLSCNVVPIAMWGLNLTLGSITELSTNIHIAFFLKLTMKIQELPFITTFLQVR
ncbi:hypothetical protein ACJX0J_014298 [Zea mays]